MTDAKEQNWVAKAVADDVKLRMILDAWQKTLKECADWMRNGGKDAFNAGYPDKQLIWDSCASRINQVAKGMRSFGKGEAMPTASQASLDLEKAL